MMVEVVRVRRRPGAVPPSRVTAIIRPITLAQIAADLEPIVDRIRRNVPKSHSPEAFHEEKSEIANDLYTIVMRARGQPVQAR
jgi:hypothetical protein